MAEQDRYGSHFGADKARAMRDSAGQHLRDHNLPQGSGAEQDRYGGWFGDKVPETHLRDKLPRVSAAEQDRYEHWFGGKAPYTPHRAKEFVRDLSKTSGAEQDRYGSHFDGNQLPSASDVADKFNAGKDRVEGWFQNAKDKAPSLGDVKDKIPNTSGAEQDRLGGWFQNAKDKAPSFDDVKDKLHDAKDRIPRPSGSGAEQDRLGSHFGRYPTNPINATAVGLLQSAVLPSFGLHSGLSAIAYAVARYTDRAEVKDILWPAGMTANAWWSAIGTRVFYDGLTVPQAWSTLTYSQTLLLSGVTAWGLRLLYRVASRGLKRGQDDPRYVAAKKKDPAGFWNKALLGLFVPEAVAQTIISLPFTLPFRAGIESVISSPNVGYKSLFTTLAVFLFSTGFALEVVADAQLEAHKQQGKSDINREGVWSIVRHPNYLGDALMHISFPILLLGANAMHPLTLLGPIANYVFLRYIGGDRENEENQEERYAKESPAKAQQFALYKREKNSFWPDVKEAQNQWTWIIAAVGVGGVALERGLRAWTR